MRAKRRNTKRSSCSKKEEGNARCRKRTHSIIAKRNTSMLSRHPRYLVVPTSYDTTEMTQQIGSDGRIIWGILVKGSNLRQRWPFHHDRRKIAMNDRYE